MPHCVYKLTNSITGDIYIGATYRTPQKRLNELASKSKTRKNKICQSIKKFGKDSFTHEILYLATSEADMYEKEIRFIESFDSIKSGLNEASGGKGNHSVFSKKECVDKSANSKKGIPREKFSVETRNKMSIKATIRSKEEKYKDIFRSNGIKSISRKDSITGKFTKG